MRMIILKYFFSRIVCVIYKNIYYDFGYVYIPYMFPFNIFFHSKKIDVIYKLDSKYFIKSIKNKSDNIRIIPPILSVEIKYYDDDILLDFVKNNTLFITYDSNLPIQFVLDNESKYSFLSNVVELKIKYLKSNKLSEVEKIYITNNKNNLFANSNEEIYKLFNKID